VCEDLSTSCPDTHTRTLGTSEDYHLSGFTSLDGLKNFPPNFFSMCPPDTFFFQKKYLEEFSPSKKVFIYYETIE
jgi:hypothetical protein